VDARSEQEILAAIEAGDLAETASLDVKALLPAKGKSRDLAIDVAAMASDGGTLLYGVDEDENGGPTVPQPFGLAGARERVDQIVRSSISEPPDIRVREIPTEEDSGIGYLVVAVPPSSRAPHMVTVGKEYRYYGRSDTGNAPLTEGEVARLYERRQRWEVDRDAMLKEAIDSALIGLHEDFAYLHLVAHRREAYRRRTKS
jgi:predicted HTH transcriptional regulator